MRLRKVEDEDRTRFSIKEVFDILVENLKDYIPSGTDLNSILEDWEYTADNEDGETQSEKDIYLSIPIKLESEIDFILSPKVRCTVDSDFKAPYARVHIYDVKGDSYRFLVTHPSIRDLLYYFCGTTRDIDDSYPFEEVIGNVNQARQFATNLKVYLDNYTKDLNTVLDCLKQMNDISYTIWKILNKK